MMRGANSVLGIDTSNYKTSVCLLDQDKNILFDERILLSVPAGKRGLRQQEAVFQHLHNLPSLFEKVAEKWNRVPIEAVSVSVKPRDAERSYMPVFEAGYAFARGAAALLHVPLFTCSHQAGHVAAAAGYTELAKENTFYAFHFSGGTTEALLVEHGSIQRLGGTLDISFGQVIDRIGVLMGYPFPAGEELDALILSTKAQDARNLLPAVKPAGLNLNLSGLETAAARLWEKRAEKSLNFEEVKAEQIRLSRMLFERIGEAMLVWMDAMQKRQGEHPFLFAGGVSSSAFLREYITARTKGKLLSVFSDPKLASDNAVGVALLGGKKIWR